jgi:hypothetical protein
MGRAEASCPWLVLEGGCPQRGGRGIPGEGVVEFPGTPIGRQLGEPLAWCPGLHLHVNVVERGSLSFLVGN